MTHPFGRPLEIICTQSDDDVMLLQHWTNTVKSYTNTDDWCRTE